VVVNLSPILFVCICLTMLFVPKKYVGICHKSFQCQTPLVLSVTEWIDLLVWSELTGAITDPNVRIGLSKRLLSKWSYSSTIFSRYQSCVKIWKCFSRRHLIVAFAAMLQLPCQHINTSRHYRKRIGACFRTKWFLWWYYCTIIETQTWWCHPVRDV